MIGVKPWGSYYLGACFFTLLLLLCLLWLQQRNNANNLVLNIIQPHLKGNISDLILYSDSLLFAHLDPTDERLQRPLLLLLLLLAGLRALLLISYVMTGLANLAEEKTKLSFFLLQ